MTVAVLTTGLAWVFVCYCCCFFFNFLILCVGSDDILLVFKNLVWYDVACAVKCSLDLISTVITGVCRLRLMGIPIFTVCSEITDYLFKKAVDFFRKTAVFYYTNCFEMHPEFLLSTLFSNWPRRLNLLKRPDFSKTAVKKLWNLDNTGRSSQINSFSSYSFHVPRKLYRITSARAATQSLSSVVNRILNDTQRSAGQFFLNRL